MLLRFSFNRKITLFTNAPSSFCIDVRAYNFFFSDWHLALKFFKVVADSKNVDRHFQRQRQTKCFFNAVSVLDRPSKIKLGIRSLTCYKVDTRMDDIQPSSSPKYKMASRYRSRCAVRVLETNLTRKFASFFQFGD